MSTGVAHRKTVGIGIKDFCLVRAETSELQPAITQPFGGQHREYLPEGLCQKRGSQVTNLQTDRMALVCKTHQLYPRKAV